jgi:CubicO group peptidase (beta-lactamase class C family)
MNELTRRQMLAGVAIASTATVLPWQRSFAAAEGFVAWHNIDSATLWSNFDTYFAQGYRFVSLSIYGTFQAPLFAAVMIRRPIVIPQYAVFGLNAADYQTAFNNYAAQGYGQLIISVTGTFDQPMFAGVWEPIFPIPLTQFGLSASDLTNLYQTARFDNNGNLLPGNTMPLSLDVYGDPGNRRYAIVMAPNTASTGWNGDGTDETAAAYQTRFNLQTSIGGRPYLVAQTDDGNYASVFCDNQIGPWQARGGLTPQEYQQTFDTLTSEGFFPIQVQGGGAGANIKLAAIFTKTETITPRTFTVTGLPASTANDPYDAAMLSIMQTYGVRQAALALAQGTHLVLARGYTYAEPGYPIVQPTTVFRQASCSKTITAIMIHQLISLGALSVSQTLQSILNLTTPDGGPPVDTNFPQITVGQLLDHISGLTTGAPLTTVLSAFPNATFPLTMNQMCQWVAAQKLVQQPGTPAAWQYNTLGYVLLGQIVAQLRGQPSYIDAVNYIAAPLNLFHTRLSVSPLSSQPADEARYTDIQMPLANSVVDADQRLVPSGYGDTDFNLVGAGGGISSAVVDMARILAALNATDNALLPPSEIQSMFEAASATINIGGTVQSMRGHGWDDCFQSNGGWQAQKGGNWVDNQASVARWPNGISMAVAWAHAQVLNGAAADGAYAWYPWFPAVFNAATSQDWGSTDLFPTFGMPTLS